MWLLTDPVRAVGQEAPTAQPAVVTEAAAAQPAAATPSAGATPVVGPDGKPVPGGPPRPGRPGQPGQPTPPGAPADDKAKAAGQPSPEANKTVTRPTKPSLPPDPRELKVRPDPNGKIRFNFHGQPWADVLEWLAVVSAMSLDWQELPSDYLNLVTQRDYTVPEARDLINRHLLSRGYTLLQNGEVLSVFKIEKLNPSLVPRVEPEELAKRLPNEYVKVSLPLEWMMSEKAVEELKPMLSPNSKITPLKNTNRIEAMDSAINLLEVYTLLKREQSDEPQQRLVKEFQLQHTRVAEVIDQLKELLGIESKPATSRQMSPQQMEAMQQQQQMMMQQQMQRQGGQPAAAPKKEEGSVHLVANVRRNSVLAHAPPDKMEIISQAIRAIDVESDQTQSLLMNINRMQIYRLHNVDPATLVKTLMEIGQMEPSTKLEVDTKSKAIIAYASLADHLTIRQIVERLDGSGRKFDVIQLRRLDADYVAGTIEFMMVGPQETKQQQPRYFDYYSSYGRSGSSDTKDDDKFRVDADVENNRLLLWANELELEEVTNLLTKLGEIPSRGGRNEKLRVLDSIAPEEMEQLLERLRQAWPSVAPNPLTLPPTQPLESQGMRVPTFDSFQPTKETRSHQVPKHFFAALSTDSEVPAEGSAQETPTSPSKTTDAGNENVPKVKTTQPPDAVREPEARETLSRGAGAQDSESQAPKSPEPQTRELQKATNGLPPSLETPRGGVRPSAPPPVSISVAPDGRLVIFSQDTQALDMLEELIDQVAPPRKDYRIYKLKHADSFWVRKNLEDFFDESDEKSSENSRRVYYYDYYSPPSDKTKPRGRLSQRKKLKLIDDLDTNSILVQGADADQLRTIEDLIRIYDQPQQADSSAARVSNVIQIKYSKAQTIAEAVKDVYRDLLSSNDKALASNNPEQKNRMPTAGTTYIINEEGAGGGGGEKERTRVTFKGKLSIGVDEVTNTLLVSTEGENLMRNVTEMIQSLDEAAKPLSSVSVVTLRGSSNATRVRDVLNRLLLEAKQPPKPNGQQGQPGAQVQQQQPGVVNGNPEAAPAAVGTQ